MFSRGHMAHQEYKCILLTELGQGGWRLQLNDVAKRNALSVVLVDECLHAIRTLPSETCLLVVAGDDLAFCSGMDRSVLSDGGEALISLNHKIGELLDAIHSLPFCVVGVMDGPAVGGGVGLMMACDWLVATPNATMKLPEWSLGVFPEQIWPYCARRAKHADLMSSLLWGTCHHASWLLDAGWVDHVVESGRIAEYVQQWLNQLVNQSPYLMRRFKVLTKLNVDAKEKSIAFSHINDDDFV